MIQNLVLDNERFHYEKYFVERIHNLLTDFICKMPEKIKDLKRKSEEFKSLEEVAQQSNLSFQTDLHQTSLFASNLSAYNQPQSRIPPVSNHDFEELLNLVFFN